MTTRQSAFFMVFVTATAAPSQSLSLQGVPTPDPPTGPGCARRIADSWIPGISNGTVVDRRSAAQLAPEKEQIMRVCKVDEATAEKAVRGKIPWDAPTFVDQGQVNNCVIWCEIRVRKIIVGDYQRREIIANLCFIGSGVARPGGARAGGLRYAHRPLLA
jgi:hypothetical protein